MWWQWWLAAFCLSACQLKIDQAAEVGGAGQPFALLCGVAGGRCFATSSADAPSWFIRWNRPAEDLTDWTAAAFPNDGHHDWSSDLAWDAASGRFYADFANVDRLAVASIDPDTLAMADVVDDSRFAAGWEGSLATLNGSLYILTSDLTASQVVRYTTAGNFQGAVTLTGDILGHSLRTDGVALYASGDLTGAWAAKIDPATLAYLDVRFADGSFSDDIGLSADSVWLCHGSLAGVARRYLLRLAKTDLSVLAVIDVGLTGADCFGAFVFGETVYLPFHTTGNGWLVRYRIADGRLDWWRYDAPAPNEVQVVGSWLFTSYFTRPLRVSRAQMPLVAK